MKNIFAYCSALLLVSAMFSCSSDSPESNYSDADMVPVRFRLSFAGISGLSTRSLAPDYKFSDGTSVSELKCYVYNKSEGDNASPVKVVDVDIKDVNENRGGDVSILLPKGQNFDVVFLGTSVPQDDASGKLYYSLTERTLTVNYSVVTSSDEELDCFFAVQKDVSSETVLEEAVVLSRPFAQLNIGTLDYDEYNAVTPVESVAVSVDGIYNKFNLMDGAIIGDPVKVNLLASPVPSGQVFPIAGFSYLSMSYLLVNLRKLVDVSMTVNHMDASVAPLSLSFEEIAVERNYQTNLYGKKLLTEYPSL